MSNSKVLMAKKLAVIQSNLMGTKFEDTSLQTLLPIIFKECLEQNLTFWFNFIEDYCVLNLRDINQENNELNIRQYMGNIADVELADIKRQVLINAFLITPNLITISSAEKEEERVETHKKEAVEEKPIQDSSIVPPSPIRIAIAGCEKDGEPVTKKNIESRLNLKGMSQDKRRQCIAYLKDME